MRTRTDEINAGRAAVRALNEDSRRGEFLRALDASSESMSEFEVSFLESFIQKRALTDPGLDFEWFTAGRRAVVDNMIHRYGMRTLKLVTVPVVPQAKPGCCGYLKRDDETRRQAVCSDPAVIKLRNGLELCADCNQVREQGLAKLRAAKQRSLRS